MRLCWRLQRFINWCLAPWRPPVGKLKDRHLVYAAWNRCPCGAGLAYVRWANGAGHWDCAAILKGEAIPSGQPGAVVHTAQLPFMFWKVKSERQPSAGGATTRPRSS